MKINVKYPLVKAGFAKRLKDLRLEKSKKVGKPVRQKDVADAIGVTARTYLEWENEANLEAVPSNVHKLIALAEYYDSDLIYICQGLFEGQKEDKHKEKYFNLYDRYKQDGNFFLLVNILMEWDDELIKRTSQWAEQLDEFYKGEI